MHPAETPKAENLVAQVLITSLVLACVTSYLSSHFGIRTLMKPTVALLMVMAFIQPFTVLAVLITIDCVTESFGVASRSRPWLLLSFLVYQIVAFSVNCRIWPGEAPWYALVAAVALPLPASLSIVFLRERAAKTDPEPESKQ